MPKITVSPPNDPKTPEEWQTATDAGGGADRDRRRSRRPAGVRQEGRAQHEANADQVVSQGVNAGLVACAAGLG